MLWFFERDGERLQCEIRPSMSAAGFDLEWTTAQEAHVEHAEDENLLAQRWIELELKWKREGWVKLPELASSRPRR